MVAGWLLLGARHPFGTTAFEIESAVRARNPMHLRDIPDPDAFGLVAWMCEGNIDDRPVSMKVCLGHPYFWDEARKFRFLTTLGSHECLKNLRSEMDRLASEIGIFGRAGKWQLNWDLMASFKSKYNMSKLSDLLRCMRNFHQHRTELTQGPVLDLHESLEGGLEEYFLNSFPILVSTLYRMGMTHEWVDQAPDLAPFLPID